MYIYTYILFLFIYIYMYWHIYDDKGGVFMGRYDVLLVCKQVTIRQHSVILI